MNDNKIVDQTNADRENQEKYWKIELQKDEIKKIPSRMSGFPLVCFVEKDGALYPIYRYEE